MGPTAQSHSARLLPTGAHASIDLARAVGTADGKGANLEPTDGELVQAARNGDLTAFEALMHRHGGRVFAMARRYGGSESDAEDLAQEIWIKAYQKLSGYRAAAPFEHWLMRVAVRTCYDQLRARRRNRELNFTDLSPEEQDWLRTWVTSNAEPGFRDVGMAAEVVHRLLDQMKPADRLVLSLLELEDRPVKEVAALTGWSVATVKVRAFRARGRMRRLLARWLERFPREGL
ncbi:MAG: RNA polymerase sigma factor [Verrucomicrobiota bacterium]|nr:RNA polymerase sigma factor [Limisphaera sp.]MDW8382559.1 RNA polymerase sigma factor [Verrucomicrobiota bacterium]